MKLIKAIFLALKDVIPLWMNLFGLLKDLFWLIMGILGLVLSIVLFPVIVWRKYKGIKNENPKRNRKHGSRLAVAN